MTVAIRSEMGARDWGLLLTLSVLWGGSFFFAEIALVELPPLSVVLGRVGFAALVLLTLLTLTRQLHWLTPRRWPAFAAMGLLNNILPFGLIVWGQTALEGGLASILNGTTPLFVVLLAHLLTKDERLTALRFGGVLCGTAGVAIMMGLGLLEGLGASLWAQLAVLGAACSYAFAGIYGRRFAGVPPLATACGQVTASTVILTPAMLLIDRPWMLPMPSATTWGAIAGMAVLCTALAYIIYFRILAVAGATNLLLVTLLIPVSAVGLGVAFLGERLERHEIGGAALIAVALLLVDGRLPRRLLRLFKRPTVAPRLRHDLDASPTSPKSAKIQQDPAETFH